MNKHFHNLVLGVSVLPALLVMPALAGKGDGYAVVVPTSDTNLTELFPSGVIGGEDFGIYAIGGTSSFETETINISAESWYPIYVTNSAVLNLGNEQTKSVTISSPYDALSLWVGYEGKNRIPHSGGKVNITTGDLNVSSGGMGISANYGESQVTINASGNVNVVATGDEEGRALHAGNSTTGKGVAKNDTSFISITAQNINLTADNIGVSAMSNGYVDLNGNVTIKAPNAILTRGDAQTYINKNADNTLKMDGNIAFDYDKATSGSKVDALVDVTMSGADSYWTGNTIASHGTGRAPDDTYMTVDSIHLTMKNGATWNATKITDNVDDETVGSWYVALNNLNIDKGTVNIADTERGIIVENATVKDATFNGGPLNIKNMSLTGGTNVFNGNVAGVDSDSVLSVNSGATMNIGKNKIDVDTIDLNGTLIAELVSDSDSIFNAATFESSEDTGKLSLAIEKAGTYNLFGNAIFDKAQEQITSTVYDLDWSTNEGKTVIATVKSADKIAEETGVSTDAATAISHVAQSESKQLQDLSVKMQEKLAAGDTAAVEHATKAVHPETESVAQSVSTSVQNTVVSLASARMSAPSVGRSGGDVEWTKGGVWAQGLFNKSKQNDAFNGYTRGIALGLDGTINKDWTIGAGYSYAHSDISGTARDTEIDSNTIFLYGQYKPAEWYVNAIANYTMSDYSEQGTVLDGAVVTGDYDVDSFGGALAMGYDFANGITPELGLRYMHVNANDYANSYGIKTHMDDTDFLTGVIGARYAFDIVATKHITFAPQLSAAMKYDMLSDKNVATIAMPGVNAYTLEGNRLKRIGGEFGVGLGMQYRELNVSVNYDIDVREDYTSQTGMLKFRYNF